MGLPRATIYWMCQCIETRKATKTGKRDSRRRAVKMPEMKRNQLVKTICEKKGVSYMKLAVKMNAERPFVARIVREAAVRTYKRVGRPELRSEMEQRQKRECGKTRAKHPFESHQHRDGPSCCPVTSSQGSKNRPPSGHLRLKNPVWRVKKFGDWKLPFSGQVGDQTFFQSGQRRCGPNVIAQGPWQTSLWPHKARKS